MADNAVIRRDATAGKVQESLATIDDNGKINIPTGQTYDINGSPHTHAGGADNSGWVSEANTWSYSSADAPTFVISINANMDAVLSVGMRIKGTQATGGTKYFIITAVAAFAAGASLITVYGGTDYTLTNEAITSPCYSTVKAPFGFPPSPAKWSVTLTDSSNRAQSSPAQNTWYNLGSLSVSIPIGSWDVRYRVSVQSLSTAARAQVTLSTANNSESDTNFTSYGGAPTNVVVSATVRALLELAAKTTYYVNARTTQASASSLSLPNDVTPLLLTAVCAYL